MSLRIIDTDKLAASLADKLFEATEGGEGQPTKELGEQMGRLLAAHAKRYNLDFTTAAICALTHMLDACSNTEAEAIVVGLAKSQQTR